MERRREAWEVYSKALAVSFAAYALNWAAEKQVQRFLTDRVLCWAVAFATVQTAVIAGLSFAMVAWRLYLRLREGLADQIRPAIRDRVLGLAFEGESWSSTVPRRGLARQVIEENLARTLVSVKAAGRDRVARFALEHGFARQWQEALSAKARDERKMAISLLGLISPVAGDTMLFEALEDPHPSVRAGAYRALLLSSNPKEGNGHVDRIFRSVLREPLLLRALLADDLKRHGAYLLAKTIPEVLEEALEEAGRKETARGEAALCFEMLIAWKRAIPSLDLRPWIMLQGETALAPLLLELLPYVWTDDSIEDYVAAALGSALLEVRCLAAQAAGRLKLTRLLPILESVLREDKLLALVGAAALAEMGEAGQRLLEMAVVGTDRKAAAVALEALERVTVNQ